MPEDSVSCTDRTEWCNRLVPGLQSKQYLWVFFSLVSNKYIFLLNVTISLIHLLGSGYELYSP